MLPQVDISAIDLPTVLYAVHIIVYRKIISNT